jgi:hypothetical protein
MYLILGTCTPIEATKLTKNNDSRKRLRRKIHYFYKVNGFLIALGRKIREDYSD